MERRLSAILAADVVGYSAMMEKDEAGTFDQLKTHRKELFEPEIKKQRGRIFKLMGDGLLAEFGSVVDAVECAVAIQRNMGERNANIDEHKRIEVRIGVNLGEVIVEGKDRHGEGVNIAARLQQLAPPGGICISGKVAKEVEKKLSFHFEPMGERHLKNIAQAIEVFRVEASKPPSEVSPRSWIKNAPPITDKPSIAVLPFQNMSGDPDQEYFSDGITEDIITELSRFHEFSVIARNSSFRYKGLSSSIVDVGRDLGVKYVIEGSVRRSGDRVRLTVQLIDVGTGAHVWADRYDRQLVDIFSIQDELTEAVVARVAEGIKGARTLHARSRPSHSATAYDLVLQARPYRTTYTVAGSEIAARLLRQAIEVDPNFALAHASLAFVRSGDFEEGTGDPDAVLGEALAAANRAVSLDGSDGYTHASLAYVLLKLGEFDRAEHSVGIALSLNPNHINIIMTSAWTSIVNCNPQRAIEMIQRARRLNPYMGGWDLWVLGQAYLDLKRYQDALDCFAKVNNPPLPMLLERAICQAYLGQDTDARRNLGMYLERSKEELPSFPGEDPVAWREFLLRIATRRRNEVTDHYLKGARKAGLNVA